MAKNKRNKKKQGRLMFCKSPTKNQMNRVLKRYVKKIKKSDLNESFSGYNPDEYKYASVENFEDSEQLQKNIDSITNATHIAEENINSYNEAINESEELLKQYSNDIESKMNIIATKDRMLQLSQDRNVYKKKIIYMLLTILIAIFITIISFYTIYNKK